MLQWGFVTVSLLFLLCEGSHGWSNETRQQAYMEVCVQLAQAAVKDGGAPYGAVIVDPEKNEIIVQGNNHASSNPIWHGEMDALNKLAGMVEKEGLTVYQVAPKLELYTSAEPCSMCMSALAWSGIGRVYYGTSIPFIASQGLNQISIRAKDVIKSTPFEEIGLVGGVLNETTNKLYTRPVVAGHRQTVHHHHYHHYHEPHGHSHPHGHFDPH